MCCVVLSTLFAHDALKQAQYLKFSADTTAFLLLVYCLPQLTMIGCDIPQGVVDTEMTEMITSGAVATLVAAVGVALTEGMILRGEVSSLADLEEARMVGEAMEMLHQGVIRMEEEKLLHVNHK